MNLEQLWFMIRLIVLGVLIGGFGALTRIFISKFLNYVGWDISPKLFFTLIMLPVGVYSVYWVLKDASKYYRELTKTITTKLSNKLIYQTSTQNIFTRLKMVPEFKIYGYAGIPDMTLQFFDSGMVDIRIKNVFGNYFKLRRRADDSLAYNSLSLTKNISDRKYIKKIYKCWPLMIDDTQVKIAKEINDVVEGFYSLKLNKNGMKIRVERKFDPKNWKHIDNFLKEVEKLPELLKKNGVYSKSA